MIRRHVLFGFLDQGVSSLTTLLILVTAAQNLPPNALGFFSIGMTTTVSCVAIVRSLTGEALLVRVTSRSRTMSTQERIRLECRSAIGLAVVLGAVAMLLVVCIGLFWAEARTVLLCAAIATPAVILHDAARHACITMKRGAILLTGDLAVLGLSISAIFQVGHLGYGPGAMLLAWGAASSIGCALILGLIRCSFSVSGGLKWFRRVWPDSSAFVLEAVLGAGIGYSIIVVLATVSSPSEVAGYTAAVSVFGVISLIINFLRTVVLREVSPDRLRFRAYIWKTFWKMALPVTTVAVLTLLAVLLVPTSVGIAWFGETWKLMVPLAPFAAVNRIAAGLSIIPLIFLRVRGVTWVATRIRLMLLAPLCISAPIASFYAGAAGALLADASFYLTIAAVLMTVTLRMASESADPDQPEDD